MPTFYGPETQTRSLVSPDPIEWARNPLGQALMRHYGTQAEGVNVYLLRSGVVTTEDPIDWDTVAHALWGAHYEPITDAEAALLTAAGYGAYIDATPPPASPPVGFVDPFGGDFA